VNLAILMEVGQRLMDADAEVFNATYECNWYKQSLKFQKALLIMREVMIKEQNIKIAGGWIFKRETFITVRPSLRVYLIFSLSWIFGRFSTPCTITTTTLWPTLK
jgi:hypothetical protein